MTAEMGMRQSVNGAAVKKSIGALSGLAVSLSLLSVVPLAKAQDLQQEMQQVNQTNAQNNQEWQQAYNQYVQNCESLGGHFADASDGHTWECLGMRKSQASDSDPGAAAGQMMQQMQSMYQQMAYQLGQKLGQWIFGNPQQKAEEAELEQQMQARALLERIRSTEARQQQLQNELSSLASQWVGSVPSENEEPFQDTSTNFFGEGGGGRTVYLTPLAGDTVARSVTTQADRLQVANCLSRLAAAPGRSPEDAKYLSQQAADAMDGMPVQVNVSGCQASASLPPPPPPAPTVDQVKLYSNLFEATNQDAEKAVALAKKIHQLQQDTAQEDQEIKKEQAVVSQLQSASSTSTEPAPAATNQAPQTAPSPSSDAMAEAEAALKQATEAKADNQKAIDQANSQMSALSQQLQQAQSCFSQAQSDPGKAASLMQSCGK